jgi:RNA polymerase sigma factor (sigma-70 family)
MHAGVVQATSNLLGSSNTGIRGMKTSSDEELVAECLAGNQAAFGSIVQRYRGLVAGVTYNGCRGDLARSEDLAQEAFLVAWQKLPALENGARLASWLCGIARNVCHAARRSSRREDSWVSLDAVPALTARQPVPGDAAMTREQQALLWRTLDAIPARYRQVMILYYRQEHSVTDVAAALDLTEATVRKRLERGRKVLRQELVRFVEDSLRETTPSPTFTAAVVGALPALGAPGLSVMGVAGVGTIAKGIGLASMLAPLTAPVAGGYAWYAEYRACRSQHERRLLRMYAVALSLAIVGFMAINFAVFARVGPSLSPGNRLLLLTGMWSAYFGTLAVGQVAFNRRRARIRTEEQTASRPVTAVIAPRLRRNMAIVTILGGTIGATGYLVSLAMQSRDWTAVALIVVVDAVACTWLISRAVRRGKLGRPELLAFFTVMMLLSAVMLNWHAEEWLSIERGKPVDVPRLSLNVFLVVLWAGMCGSVFLDRRAKELDARA